MSMQQSVPTYIKSARSTKSHMYCYAGKKISCVVLDLIQRDDRTVVTCRLVHADPSIAPSPRVRIGVAHLVLHIRLCSDAYPQ